MRMFFSSLSGPGMPSRRLLIWNPLQALTTCIENRSGLLPGVTDHRKLQYISADETAIFRQFTNSLYAVFY